MAKKYKLRRSVAAIMALALVVGAAPVKPIGDLFMPEVSVSAAETTNGVKFAGMNVVAGGKLGVTFFLSVEDSFKYNDTAYVKISCAGKEIARQNVKDAEKSGDFLAVVGNVAAKQMTDTITAEVFANDSATESLAKASTTIQKYAEYQLNSSSSSTELKNLIKAMLNYGAYAQTQFGYNPSKLANANLSATDKKLATVTADTLSAYKHEILVESKNADDSVNVAEIAGISATLESETELNVYITPGKGFTANNLIFACTDGVNTFDVEAVESGDYIILKIKDIAAKSLAKDLIISVEKKVDKDVESDKEGLTVADEVVLKASVLSYVYGQINSNNAALKNTVTALYHYNRAAVEYFDSERIIASTTISGSSALFKKHEVTSETAFNENGKFIITVPAQIEDKNGISSVIVKYQGDDGKYVAIDSSAYEAIYNADTGVSTVAVDSSAVPSGKLLLVEVKVAPTLEFSIVEGSDACANYSVTNSAVFKGEEFRTVLIPADAYALPDTITINEVGKDEALELDKDFTYDSLTGEIVVFSPGGSIKVALTSVDKHEVTYNLTGLKFANVPSTIGNGFKTTIEVTDADKYRVPDKMSIYGDTGLIDGYLATTTVDKDGEAVTTYTTVDNLNDNVTLPSSGCYYIINKKDENGNATLELKNVEDDIVIVAKAVESFNVKTTLTGLVASANKPGDKVNLEAIPTKVDKGGKYDTIYLSLEDAEDDSLIVPSSITVKMAGKELSASNGDYTFTADGTIGTLTIGKEVTGDIEIIAVAAERCSLTTKLSNLKLDNAASGTKDIGVGDATFTLTTTNASKSLPVEIDVTLNGNELTAGKDYSYNSETGVITVYGLVKGDKLYIEAKALDAYAVDYQSSTGVQFVADNGFTVLDGEDFTCKLVVSDTTKSISDITVSIAGETVENTEDNTYYEYDKTTGVITVYDVEAEVAIVAECATEYDVSLTYNQLAKKVLIEKGYDVSIDNAIAHAQYNDSDTGNYVANITVSDPEAMDGLTASAEFTIGGKKVTTDDVTNLDDWFKEESKGNYIITIPRSNITGDVVVSFGVVESKYTVSTDDLQHLTISSGTTENIDYESELVLTVAADVDYALPESLTVEMGGKELTGVYDSETGKITIAEVTDNIVITGSADYAVKLGDTTVAEGVNVTVSADANGNSLDDAYFHEVGETLAVNINLDGADAYKYELDTNNVKVTVDGVNIDSNKSEDNAYYTISGNTVYVYNADSVVTITPELKEKGVININAGAEIKGYVCADNAGRYIRLENFTISKDDKAEDYSIVDANNGITAGKLEVVMKTDTDGNEIVDYYKITGVSNFATGSTEATYSIVKTSQTVTFTIPKDAEGKDIEYVVNVNNTSSQLTTDENGTLSTTAKVGDTITITVPAGYTVSNATGDGVESEDGTTVTYTIDVTANATFTGTFEIAVTANI